MIFGLSFDLDVEASPNTANQFSTMYAEDCWNISLLLRIENGLSEDYFTEQSLERQQWNESSYGGSDAASWLLSLAQALLLSLILWQPLLVYTVTWIKVWMFTWHLEMKFPKNCPALIKRCCCGYEVDDEELLSDMIAVQMTRIQALSSSSLPAAGAIMRRASLHSQIIAPDQRFQGPLAFLANDKYVIDDTVELDTGDMMEGPLCGDGGIELVVTPTVTAFQQMTSDSVEEAHELQTTMSHTGLREVVQCLENEIEIESRTESKKQWAM